MQWIIVAALGGLVGVAELVSRYRDAPGSVFKTLSAVIYLAINGAAALLALYVVEAMDWQFGGDTESQQQLFKILVAGFGAMAFLRSSFFTLKIGEADVAVGPSAILTALLGTADRNIDRVRAVQRLKISSDVMAGFNIDRDLSALVSNVSAAMQNLSIEESTSLAAAAEAVKNMNATDKDRSIALGLVLLNVAGEDLLRQAISSTSTA